MEINGSGSGSLYEKADNNIKNMMNLIWSKQAKVSKNTINRRYVHKRYSHRKTVMNWLMQFNIVVDKEDVGVIMFNRPQVTRFCSVCDQKGSSEVRLYVGETTSRFKCVWVIQTVNPCRFPNQSSQGGWRLSIGCGNGFTISCELSNCGLENC